jgi:hypothetical protein
MDDRSKLVDIGRSMEIERRTSEVEVVDILRAARDAVATAEIPEELRGVAFAKAVDLLSGPSGQIGKPPLGNLPPSNDAGESAHSVTAVSRKLGLQVPVLESVYDLTDDAVTVVIARSRLPEQKGPATKLLALLLAVGRQSAGYDDGWTATEVIRQQCSDVGIFDGNHFAESIGQMDDVFVHRGKGLRREVKVTQHGYEVAAREIRRLLGNE